MLNNESLLHNTNPVENVSRLEGCIRRNDKTKDNTMGPMQITDGFGGARSLCRAHFLRFFLFHLLKKFFY